MYPQAQQKKKEREKETKKREIRNEDGARHMLMQED
jgi:hypothetical protein